jgi:hypothetical protein
MTCEDAVVRIEHVRRAGYCVRGVRRWLEAHGRTLADLCDGRVTAAWLLGTGDAMAQAVARIAMGEDG